MQETIQQPQNLVAWLRHLESLHPKNIALGLERVAEVQKRLDIEPPFPVIVIGGTNGKGSVCAMLEAMFYAAGYKVGCYTSPHLLVYNERVRIGKQAVSDAELCASFEQIEKFRGDIPLTYFEFGTLAAMQSFILHHVDVAILEVGLGGRLDAVNVFESDCSVVTSVDIDHTDYLGDTREQIAFEKAGTFRKGKVAIFGDNDMPEAIFTQSQKVGSQLWQLGKQFSFKYVNEQWDYQSALGFRLSLPYPALRGAFQLNNASTALAVLDVFKENLPVSMSAVRRGLLEVELPGRFQVLPGRPMLIFDVAHNPHAANSLAKNLLSMPPSRQTFAVCAMLKDKDIAGVVRTLNPHIDKWLVGSIDAPRGATAEELVHVLEQEGVIGEVQAFNTVTEALNHACKEAGENDRIITFGSFYTVAEAMRAKSA
jgi:dihydrofolate synthase/folylpolyglutamate synthase